MIAEKVLVRPIKSIADKLTEWGYPGSCTADEVLKKESALLAEENRWLIENGFGRWRETVHELKNEMTTGHGYTMMPLLVKGINRRADAVPERSTVTLGELRFFQQILEYMDVIKSIYDETIFETNLKDLELGNIPDNGLVVALVNIDKSKVNEDRIVKWLAEKSNHNHRRLEYLSGRKNFNEEVEDITQIEADRLRLVLDGCNHDLMTLVLSELTDYSRELVSLASDSKIAENTGHTEQFNGFYKESLGAVRRISLSVACAEAVYRGDLYKPKNEKVDLREVAEDTLHSMSRSAVGYAETRDRLYKVFESEDHPLRGSMVVDRTLLVLVLRNLMGNAVKYGVSKSKQPLPVDVQLEETDDSYIVTVVDSGIGMSNELVEALNGEGDSYVRGDNALKAGIEGTGFGFNSCKKAVRTHFPEGSKIEISSAEGLGTTAKLVIKKG